MAPVQLARTQFLPMDLELPALRQLAPQPKQTN
jgi:hypothetical protein